MHATEPNLPYDPILPRETALEIDTIEAEIGRFLRGELSLERYRSFRLANGIYGQRQPGVQMIRVKIPTGDLDGRQLRRLADIAAGFTPKGLAHLTTRQDVQFHFVPLERVPHLLRLLADVGLSTREACGNSVRNVTACPVTGFIADELFNVHPYAMATWGYLVRNPFCQQLARKFKIALSSCPEDCASTAIHDIGLVGRIVGTNGTSRLGFKIVVGGGLGTTPFTAKTLEEFVPLEEILPTIKGILKVFAELGNRRNKMKARLKFVVNKLGIEEFRLRVARAVEALTPEEREEAALQRYLPTEYEALVAAHLAGRTDLGNPALIESKSAHPISDAAGAEIGRRAVRTAPSSGLRDGGARRPSRGAAPTPQPPPPWQIAPPDTIVGLYGASPGKADTLPPELTSETAPAALAAFLRWQSRSVRAHRNPERAVVTVVFPLGDLDAPRLRSLGDLVTRHGGDRARVAIDQNLVLPDVPRHDLRVLHAGLSTLGLAEPTARTAIDITSCPGADTCALGITSSKGLTRAIRAELLPMADNGGLRVIQDITIKISGCPNSCGQHHVANLGFHGVAKNVGGKQIPAYQLHLGGKIGQGEARIGTALDKIPARKVPGAVAALLGLFKRERAGEESFADFVARAPKETIQRTLAPYTTIDAADEALGVDWEQQGAFTTEEIGAGECAGAGIDAAVNPFDNFEAEILQAALFMEREQWVDAVANLGRSRYTLARILLERLGKNPESDYETACELRAQVIDRGLASDLWNEFSAEAESLLRTREPSPRAVLALQGRAQELLEEAKRTLPLLERKKSEGGAEIPG